MICQEPEGIPTGNGIPYPAQNGDQPSSKAQRMVRDKNDTYNLYFPAWLSLDYLTTFLTDKLWLTDYWVIGLSIRAAYRQESR